MAMKNEDNVKTDDEAILKIIEAGVPGGKKPTMPPGGPPRGQAPPQPPAVDVDHVSIGLRAELEEPFSEVVFPKDYEYVLCIPKSLAMEKVTRPGDADMEDGKMRAEKLAPQDWQPGVKFYINGVEKKFHELAIELTDEVKLDARGRSLPVLPKVIIRG